MSDRGSSLPGAQRSGALGAPAPHVVAPPASDDEYAVAPAETRPTATPLARRLFVRRRRTKRIVESRDDEPNELNEAIEVAPPWLISFVVHIALFIGLGLLAGSTFLYRRQERRPEVDIVSADTLGEPLLDERVKTPHTQSAIDDHLAFVTADLAPADDPFAGSIGFIDEPPQIGANLASSNPGEVVGLSFRGREAGMKAALLGRYGGNAVTESAVRLGLEWLARQQTPDGSWRLDGPYTNGAATHSRVGATAMALLALQGAGNTHRRGSKKDVVAAGWSWLLAQQDDAGCFYHDADRQERMYSQAMATIALCELAGMTDDALYRDAAKRAIQYAVEAQDRELGGWRYEPNRDSDTSVTGWVVMSLQSAKMAYLPVPRDTIEHVARYLDSVEAEEGSRYAYQVDAKASLTMTAEALLCRQYLGWPHDDPRLRAGASYLRQHLPSWEDRNVYYWYYATQVLRHMDGADWQEWNGVMRELLPANQVKEGPERGSWNPGGDRYGMRGGRLYVTCLSICILEVYYRHLPLYTRIYPAERITQGAPN